MVLKPNVGSTCCSAALANDCSFSGRFSKRCFDEASMVVGDIPGSASIPWACTICLFRVHGLLKPLSKPFTSQIEHRYGLESECRSRKCCDTLCGHVNRRPQPAAGQGCVLSGLCLEASGVVENENEDAPGKGVNPNMTGRCCVETSGSLRCCYAALRTHWMIRLSTRMRLWAYRQREARHLLLCKYMLLDTSTTLFNLATFTHEMDNALFGGRCRPRSCETKKTPRPRSFTKALSLKRVARNAAVCPIAAGELYGATGTKPKEPTPQMVCPCWDGHAG